MCGRSYGEDETITLICNDCHLEWDSSCKEEECPECGSEDIVAD